MKNYMTVRFAPYLLLFLLIGCTKEAVPQVAMPSIPVVTEKQIIKETDVINDLVKPVELDDRFSYTYGYMLYTTLQQQGFGNLDASYFAKGALDAQRQKGFFTQEEMGAILYEVQTNMLQIAQQELEALAEQNLKTAQEFLATNGTREQVKSTESGLQYEVLSVGEGQTPTEESIVEVDYQILLPNGRVVDSSYERGQSSTFQLKAIMVPGFIEGVKLMSVGSKYRFWIHPDLAYGKEGTQTIEPNTLLIVEVELKAIR
ncbi:MAG: FKBP-type peptidyl-prolyl cis-trans isomerase [Sphaerochaeta sp.]|uniref:FKBP-type peptidyl-prolyl cis-trans isomerase n=1 Tax=Sphaerochaeta sp. TaxID=1972642 RepID=UPI003D11C369